MQMAASLTTARTYLLGHADAEVQRLLLQAMITAWRRV